MAIHTYEVPGVAEPLALQMGFWRPRLLQGGVALERIGREYEIRLASGAAAPAHFQRVLLGFDIPDLVIDGVPYAFGPRLPIIVVVWCFLPLALIGFGGAIPAVIGFSAALGNLRLMRIQASPVAKAAASIGLTVGAVMTVLLIAVLLTHLLHR